MPPGKAEIIVGTDRLKPPVVYEPCTVAVVASVGAQGDMCQSSTWQHWGQKDTINNLGRTGGHVC